MPAIRNKEGKINKIRDVIVNKWNEIDRQATVNHRLIALTWPYKSVGDDATVFTPIESNQRQIDRQYHQEDGQQYRLQFGELNGTK